LDYYHFIYLCHLGIPITCHAGEWPNSIDNIRSAVSLGVDRIGHGITLIEDMILLQEVVSKKYAY
jgi:adenosine deaminase